LYHNTCTLELFPARFSPVHIQISVHDGVPIYRQIVNQVKYMVASSQLLPGEELPPIRVLAKQLLVTPNTVVKAYDDLEGEGVVRKRQGSGTYVSEFMSPLARREQRKILAQRADALLTEAHQMNFAFPDLLELLRERHQQLMREKDERHVRKSN
jgi:GntR family transcriptional regulator